MNHIKDEHKEFSPSIEGYTRVHRDCGTDNLKILAQFVDKNGICQECGRSHRFKPVFKNIKNSMDFMPLLLQMLRKLEQLSSRSSRVYDLSKQLKHEVDEFKKLDPKMFGYVAKMAVTQIFENIDSEYFHQPIMQFLNIRFVRNKKCGDCRIYRGSTSHATQLHVVKLIKRKSWFCDACAVDLKLHDLAEEIRILPDMEHQQI